MIPAIDSDRGAWASPKWGGLLHLKVDQMQKYSGDDNKMSRRRVCPAFVALLHFFFPSHLSFSSQWATRFSQAFVPRSYFRNRELLYAGLLRYYILTSLPRLEFVVVLSISEYLYQSDIRMLQIIPTLIILFLCKKSYIKESPPAVLEGDPV